jgi:hypothetical protein
VAGAIVPLVMKKPGADAAMASSIVVTTFTDVGCLLVFRAGCRNDLNRSTQRVLKKDSLAERAALSVAHYETESIGFNRSYRLRLVSGF